MSCPDIPCPPLVGFFRCMKVISSDDPQLGEAAGTGGTGGRDRMVGQKAGSCRDQLGLHQGLHIGRQVPCGEACDISQMLGAAIAQHQYAVRSGFVSLDFFVSFFGNGKNKMQN